MPTFDELMDTGVDGELLLLVMIFLPEEITNQIILGDEEEPHRLPGEAIATTVDDG